MRRVISLARLQSTGTPTELADRLGIPERTLYRMIETMKELEIPISYNRHRRTYTLRDRPHPFV